MITNIYKITKAMITNIYIITKTMITNIYIITKHVIIYTKYSIKMSKWNV